MKYLFPLHVLLSRSTLSSVSISRRMSGVVEGLHGRTLKHEELLRHQAYVDGRWVDAAAASATLTVTNPASGKSLGTVPDMSEVDTLAAIDAAHAAFNSWKKTTAKERAVVLRRWFGLVTEHVDDLALLLTAEAGKPLTEARGEVLYGASFIEWFAEEGKRMDGEVLQPGLPNREVFVIRQPIGVTGMITPWNFPTAMITRKAAAALAAGCTCVVKPAEDTPFSALALAQLAHEAGVPPGVFNVVTASKPNAPAVGNLFCTSPKVAGISFTGSTGVGRVLYKQCAAGVKRMALELGGNAPFIVFSSARIPTAITALMVAKFRNAGQTCISANRILVAAEVFEEFVAAAVTAMEKLVVGDPLDDGVTIGPLINQPQFNKVSDIVDACVAAGAKVVMGGRPHPRGGLYYTPTLLTDVTPAMPCFTEEIFGPVVAIAKFSTEEEAVTMANDCNVGLAGYLFSQDVSQVFRVARALEVGMVGVNEGLISAAEGPFGGVKQSGMGREGSRHGLDEYTYIKSICLGGINN